MSSLGTEGGLICDFQSGDTSLRVLEKRNLQLPRGKIRALRAAGLVVQRRRSDYAGPAGRVIGCLVLVAAAQGCAHVREFAS